MATLHPFRAIRPLPEYVEAVASVPYDVVSTQEARELVEGNPYSFLRVVRPEIELPEWTAPFDDAVYEKGAENLCKHIQGSHTLREEEPSLYVYSLTQDGREQTGVFGCVAVAEYDEGIIIRHEETRPVKEDDRTRHILEQRAHAEAVMLTYRDEPAVERCVARVRKEPPLYDFVASDGVRHRLWPVEDMQELVEAFGNVPAYYIADGHHRCKAASRAAEKLREREDVSSEVEFFPAVLFPMGEMQILSYHRVVKDLPESPETFLAQLDDRMPVERGVSNPVPEEKGSVCIYLNGEWHRLMLPESKRNTVASALDVARLGEHVLEPLLGITDPRRDPTIDFIGGRRGPAALERIVESGEAAMAISMYPTSIEELVRVADAGELMPPKSTWFEPKVASGLLVHTFDTSAYP